MEIQQKLLKKTNQNYFNLNTYKDLMVLLKSKYNFKLFNDDIKKEGVYLRHDIDIHPYFIKKFIKIYDQLEIKANFFFLLNSPNYNVLSNEFKLLSDYLLKKNHLIGMHICNKLKWNKKDIIINQLYYKKKLGFSNVFSFHQPSKKNFSLKINKMINVYNKDYFSDEKYVSDINKKKSFLKKILNLINIKKKNFQILIHPIWWTYQNNNLENKLKKIFFYEYNNYVSSISKKLIIKKFKINMSNNIFNCYD